MMINWKLTSTRLQSAYTSHRKLMTVFETFAKYVDTQVREENFFIRGITSTLNLKLGTIALTFAGRTVTYVFSPFANDAGLLVGKVDCYLKQEFPDATQKMIGGFTFNAQGKTDQKDSEDNEEIYIDTDLSSLNVALHFLKESLSK